MRALVVGGGSIAVRHANVLTAQGLEVSFVSQRADLAGKTHASIFDALAAEKFDYVVVANETNKHESALVDLESFAGRILVEKPLAISPHLLSKFADGQIMVAFNLRFHACLIWLQQQLVGQEVLSVECYVGQDLASWRPSRPVSQQYSAHQARGGGALRDLSHELDYLTWLFGDWVQVAAIGGRIGEVTVDSDDSWAIIAEFAGAKQVSIQLNYLDKQTQRRLIVNTAKDTFTVDLVNFKVSQGKSELSIEGSGADTYIAMHKAALSEENGALCSAGEAIATDRLIESIERAAAGRVWVSQ